MTSSTIDKQQEEGNEGEQNQQVDLTVTRTQAPQPSILTIDDLTKRQEEPDLVGVENNVADVDFEALVRSLRVSGQVLRSDKDQPSLLTRPQWFNEELYINGKSVYGRHFMGVNFAHLSGLLLLVRVDSIFNTLNLTGKSSKVSKLFRRYYHTIRHVKSWYEGDIFEEHSDAYRSILMVRGMHNKVSSKLNELVEATDNINNPAQNQSLEETDKLMTSHEKSVKFISKNTIEQRVHISMYDIMLTQFAFVGFIVTSPHKMGLLGDFEQHDMDSLLHFWRIIGYYLGVSDRYNLCSYDFETIKKICIAIMRVEYKESLTKNKLTQSEQGIMSINIVRSLKFLPMLTVYGIMRYLYEIFEYQTNELDDRRTWYSNLSYTFINLVMSNILAYKPLRMFNNGLTRLSLHLIGKLEEWFSNHLDSKYGHELKV